MKARLELTLFCIKPSFSLRANGDDQKFVRTLFASEKRESLFKTKSTSALFLPNHTTVKWINIFQEEWVTIAS